MSKKSSYIAFIAITILQILCIIFWAQHKENYYWDEYYTLERAHYASDSTPGDHYITSDENFSYNKWIDTEIIRDTLTVTKDESVLNDNLFSTLGKLFKTNSYSVLLNIIMAIFYPGQITAWASITLNILLFVLNQIVLFSLAKRIIDQDTFALSVCSFYGFSCICIYLVTFVRFYMLATLTANLFTYMHYLYWDCEDNQYISKICYMILAFLSALVGYNNAQFILFYVFFFVISFSVELFLKRGSKNALLYVGPIISFGIVFILINPEYIYILKNINHISDMANGPGALEWFFRQIISFKLLLLCQRIPEMIYLIADYMFSGIILLIAFAIIMISRCFTWKGSKDRNDIHEYGFITFSVAAFLVFFMIFGLYAQVRYVSFVFAELAVVIIIGLYKTIGNKKLLNIITVIFLCIQVILVNTTGNFDMLYQGDKEQMNIVRNQDIDSVILTCDSVITFAVYQSAIMTSDDAELYVYDEYSNTDIDCDLRDRMLVVVENDDKNILKILNERNYSLTQIARTYFFKVYVANKE